MASASASICSSRLATRPASAGRQARSLASSSNTQLDQLRLDVVARVPEIGRRFVQDPARPRGVIGAVVETPSCEELEQHDAEREQIRAPIRLLEAQPSGAR